MDPDLDPGHPYAHSGDALRFAMDLTDAEFAVLEPLFKAPAGVGRPPTPLREVLQAIFYVMRAGCPWRMLPDCFPPRQTVHGWFATWRDDGTWEAVNHHLVMFDRERVGRVASRRVASRRVAECGCNGQSERQDYASRWDAWV